MEERTDNPICSGRVTLLLGAGVSIPIGIPAMTGIYSDFLKPSKSGITRPERNVCNLLTGELGVSPDLEEFLLAANAIDDFGTSTLSHFVERCMSTRPDARRLKDYRNRLEEKTRHIRSTRTRILQHLSETCFRFDRAKACDVFDGLVRVVSDRGCPVFSTNYDFAIEHVAVQAGISIEDNFQHRDSRYIWNSKINFPTGRGLTLIKLHGSVTWYADETGEIEKIQHNTNINTAGRDADKLIVFPTRFKDIYDQHFFALYSHFISVLSVSEVLVISGHSLRDDYLRAAIIEQFRKGTLLIVVIDPIFPALLASELSPSRVGQSGRVTHVPFKLEDVSNDIAHIIAHSSPLQIPDQCGKLVHFRRSRSNKVLLRGRIARLKSGEEMELKVGVEAYLEREHRPALLRVWIESEQQELARERSTSAFLDDGNVVFGAGLSGTVQKETVVKINVPKNTVWFDAGRVTLVVALVRRSVRSPRQLSTSGAIVSTSRQLRYSV